jgi:ATPase subunit of ABC transporter with duplicated ATPase domains
LTYPILTLSSVSLSFDGKLLFQNVNLSVEKGDRICLVGRNGSGKSTLLKIIAGTVMPDSGKRFLKPGSSVAYLRQSYDLSDYLTMEAFVFDGLEKKDYLKYEDSFSGISINFNVNPANASGGELRRAALLKTFLTPCDIMLLDEPTNHLDVHAIEWLCKFLLSLKTGSLMVISHDPHFLNAVCTDIVQYRDKKLVYYKGNFDAFKQANAISDDDAEVLLAGNLSFDRERAADGAAAANDKQTEDATDETGKKSSSPAAEESKVVDTILEEPKAAAAKLVFPIPGKLDGIRNNSKPVMEIKDVYF